MKLIKCHIENFGKLSNLDIDFTSDSNVISQENGWGKSTLVTFIKVMFFGFSSEKAKKIVDNDRKKFKPWQGGVYGGQIIFEAAGKSYELYRTFGSKVSEDTFSLMDTDTNLDSKDYGENIGEELFKIDGESFLRTACISQNDCVTGVTDRINSKIGNLTDNTDDINNYEKVIKQLDDMKNKLSPRRKTGEISKLTEQIHNMQSGISSEEEIEKSVLRNRELIENEKNNRDNLKKELVEVQEKIESISRNREILTKLETYEKICQNFKEKSNELETLKSYFKNRVPEKEELSEAIEKGDRLSALETKMDSSILNAKEYDKLQKLKRVFLKGIPDDSEIAAYKEKTDILDKLKLNIASEKLTNSELNEIEAYNKKFGYKDCDTEVFDKYIREWNTRCEIKAGLGLKKATLSNYRFDNDSKNNTENVSVGNKAGLMLIGGVAFIIIGIVLLLIKSILIVPSVICFFAGLTGIILYFSGSKKAKNTIQEMQKNKELKDESILKYQQEIDKDGKYVSETEMRIKKFIEEFGEFYSEPEVLNCLYNLKGDFVKYTELVSKQKIYNSKCYEAKCEKVNADIVVFLGKYFSEEEIYDGNYIKLLQQIEMNIRDFELLNSRNLMYLESKEKYENINDSIEVFIKNIGIEPEQNLVKQLSEINITLKDYLRVFEEFGSIVREKQLFEEKNDIKVLSEYNNKINQMDNESIDELKNVQSKINERLEKVSDNIHHYQNLIDSYSKELEEIMEDKALLLQLKEKKEELSKKYIITEHTREYLQKAKENLTSKYMSPIMKSFSKYYEILTKKESDNCKIDAKINIKVMEKGEQRDTEFLSTGYQDLIGICMRIALVDAMYEEEKPFLIFDDPFVNLDETKVSGGIALLKEISKNYQIIYLTCHESRGF